jgi:hypothetical protein
MTSTAFESNASKRDSIDGKNEYIGLLEIQSRSAIAREVTAGFPPVSRREKAAARISSFVTLNFGGTYTPEHNTTHDAQTLLCNT